MEKRLLNRTVVTTLRIIGYLCTIIGLSLLAKGALNLLNGFAIPFEISPTLLLILEIIFILLFGFVALLVIIHFFKTKDLS